MATNSVRASEICCSTFHKRFELLFAMQAAPPEKEDQKHRMSVEVGQRNAAQRHRSASNRGPPTGATTVGPARAGAAGRPASFEFLPGAANRSEIRNRERSAQAGKGGRVEIGHPGHAPQGMELAAASSGLPTR